MIEIKLFLIVIVLGWRNSIYFFGCGMIPLKPMLPLQSWKKNWYGIENIRNLAEVISEVRNHSFSIDIFDLIFLFRFLKCGAINITGEINFSSKRRLVSVSVFVLRFPGFFRILEKETWIIFRVCSHPLMAIKSAWIYFLKTYFD